MHLTELITVERVLPELKASSKGEALDELAAMMAGAPLSPLSGAIASALRARERLASTAIGDAIAIPHGKLAALEHPLLGLARSKGGVDFEAVDRQPTRLFFVLLAAEGATGLHLKALARISRLCQEPLFRGQLLEAPGAEEMLEVLCREDAKFHL